MNSSLNDDFRYQNFVLLNQKLKKQKWQCSQNLDFNPTCVSHEGTHEGTFFNGILTKMQQSPFTFYWVINWVINWVIQPKKRSVHTPRNLHFLLSATKIFITLFLPSGMFIWETNIWRFLYEMRLGAWNLIFICPNISSREYNTILSAQSMRTNQSKPISAYLV